MEDVVVGSILTGCEYNSSTKQKKKKNEEQEKKKSRIGFSLMPTSPINLQINIFDFSHL
jgi:hypothetical protein